MLCLKIRPETTIRSDRYPRRNRRPRTGPRPGPMRRARAQASRSRARHSRRQVPHPPPSQAVTRLVRIAANNLPAVAVHHSRRNRVPRAVPARVVAHRGVPIHATVRRAVPARVAARQAVPAHVAVVHPTAVAAVAVVNARRHVTAARAAGDQASEAVAHRAGSAHPCPSPAVRSRAPRTQFHWSARSWCPSTSRCASWPRRCTAARSTSSRRS